MRRAVLWLSLAGIIALNVLGSLYWIRQNIVLVGRDPGGHLERTLRAAEILATPSARTSTSSPSTTIGRPCSTSRPSPFMRSLA
jgi:hypothetical protein